MILTLSINISYSVNLQFIKGVTCVFPSDTLKTRNSNAFYRLIVQSCNYCACSCFVSYFEHRPRTTRQKVRRVKENSITMWIVQRKRKKRRTANGRRGDASPITTLLQSTSTGKIQLKRRRRRRRRSSRRRTQRPKIKSVHRIAYTIGPVVGTLSY